MSRGIVECKIGCRSGPEHAIDGGKFFASRYDQDGNSRIECADLFDQADSVAAKQGRPENDYARTTGKEHITRRCRSIHFGACTKRPG